MTIEPWISRRAALPAVLAVALAWCRPIPPLAALTPGINPSDTYVTFDVTVEQQVTLQFSEPMIDPETGAATFSTVVEAPGELYHLEAGYDLSDRRVVELRPLAFGGQAAPADPIASVRMVGGEMIAYDAAGNALSIPAPPSAPSVATMPLLRPGLAPVTQGFVGSEAELAAPGDTVTRPSYGSLVITSSFPNATSGTAERTYESSGWGRWVLKKIAVQATGPRFSVQQTMRFSNVAWNSNPAGDQRRAAAGDTSGASLLTGNEGRRDFAAFGEPPPDISDVVAPPPPEPTAPPPYLAAPGNGQNVAFQHGFNSSPETWARMVPWLSQVFRFGLVLKPQTTSTAGIDTQAGELIDQLEASGQTDFLLIGHSAGGLVVRKVAQTRPDLVRGVITVSSPHQGSLLLNQSQALLIAALLDRVDHLYAGCSSPFDDFGCFLAATLYGATPFLVSFGFDAALPATRDMKVGSFFLADLNFQNEAFTSVNIENATVQRWIVPRILGDRLCDPESACGGRAFVTYSELAYLGFRLCSFLAALHFDFELAYTCDYIADAMNSVDNFWRKLSADANGGDGLIHSTGQIYPGADFRRIVFPADSHSGETRSDRVRDALVTEMDRVFQVPRQGSTNPAPVLASIQPTTAAVGIANLALTVRGSNLGTYSTVQIDGENRPTRYDNQARALVASLPAADFAAAGLRQVRVVNAAPGGGTSGAATLAVGTGNPVPVLSAISPATVDAGSPAFPLTVTGSDFVTGATVTLDGSSRTTSLISPTQLTATILASDLAQPGTRTISVVNPGPGGGPAAASAALTVVAVAGNPVPVVTSIFPSTVLVGTSAFSLTVSGSNFVPGATVAVDGSLRTTTFVSATQLSAAMTAGDRGTVGNRQITAVNPPPGGGPSTTAATLQVIKLTSPPPPCPTCPNRD